MRTPIVTLTTDWGNQGFFAGMVKGALMSMIEGVQVVDVAHHVEPFNERAASFVVKHACLGFPPETVHIIDVASVAPFVAVKARGQYFLCSDNGIPMAALGDDIEEVVTIPIQENGIYNFAAYTLFAGVAAKLLGGTPLSDIGPRHGQLQQRNIVGWIPQGDQYRISIHYVDSYGHAYLGMTYKEFEQLRQGRSFVMTVREYEVTEITASYQQAATDGRQRSMVSGQQRMQLTVSATGVLELAVQRSSFSQLIGLRANNEVLLRFKN